MGAWRYVTDCLTGHRVWHWYRTVGPPEIGRLLLPCGKAALALPPLLWLPGDHGTLAAPTPPAPVFAMPSPFGAALPYPSGGNVPFAGENGPYSPVWVPPGSLAPPLGLSPTGPPLQSLGPMPIIAPGPVPTAPPLTPQMIATPEPGSLALLATGLLLLWRNIRATKRRLA